MPFVLIIGCQKAYQKTANIGEIILDITETIAICNHHKAFDLISHDYIYEMLTYFNFG